MEVSAVAYAVEAVISVGAVVGAFVGEGNLIANQTRITPAMATRIEIWVVEPPCFAFRIASAAGRTAKPGTRQPPRLAKSTWPIGRIAAYRWT
jgi:hypothetical protein